MSPTRSDPQHHDDACDVHTGSVVDRYWSSRPQAPCRAVATQPVSDVQDTAPMIKATSDSSLAADRVQVRSTNKRAHVTASVPVTLPRAAPLDHPDESRSHGGGRVRESSQRSEFCRGCMSDRSHRHQQQRGIRTPWRPPGENRVYAEYRPRAGARSDVKTIRTNPGRRNQGGSAFSQYAGGTGRVLEEGEKLWSER